MSPNVFISLLWLNSIPLCICVTFFSNICFHTDFTFFGYMSSRVTARTYRVSSLNFFYNFILFIWKFYAFSVPSFYTECVKGEGEREAAWDREIIFLPLFITQMVARAQTGLGWCLSILGQLVLLSQPISRDASSSILNFSKATLLFSVIVVQIYILINNT